LSFLGRFPKDPQISNFTKIPQVESELLHEGGQTDWQMRRS